MRYMAHQLALPETRGHRMWQFRAVLSRRACLPGGDSEGYGTGQDGACDDRHGAFSRPRVVESEVSLVWPGGAAAVRPGRGRMTQTGTRPQVRGLPVMPRMPPWTELHCTRERGSIIRPRIEHANSSLTEPSKVSTETSPAAGPSPNGQGDVGAS